MSEDLIRRSEPFHPKKLRRKANVSPESFFELDLRSGVVTSVESFPEMNKPSYKIEVDFGPVTGRLWFLLRSAIMSQRVDWKKCSWSFEHGQKSSQQAS